MVIYNINNTIKYKGKNVVKVLNAKQITEIQCVKNNSQQHNGKYGEYIPEIYKNINRNKANISNNCIEMRQRITANENEK